MRSSGKAGLGVVVGLSLSVALLLPISSAFAGNGNQGGNNQGGNNQGGNNQGGNNQGGNNQGGNGVSVAPEPASLLLLASGGAAFGLYQLRRRRRS